ncbi:MAG: glutamine--fructose-6-phosphate transaminase (isomerizing) [Planctomycetota bacterium]
MCGIIGCVSRRPVAPILMEGLKRLEYRGYDSAGLVVLEGGIFRSKKTAGKLRNLDALLKGHNFLGDVGIGHTRWATHGAPSTSNAHPFFSCDNSIAVVHNGIIENYQELRKELIKRKHRFQSETDSEVVVHLVEEYLMRHEPLEAVRLVCQKLMGSFALVFMFKKYPDFIIGARFNSPLVIGLGQRETFVASDVPAFLRYTKKVVFLEDKQIVEIRRPPKKVSSNKPSLRIIDFTGRNQPFRIARINWNIESAEKEGYAHFMLKEIYEQPEAVKRTVSYPHYSVIEPIKNRLARIKRVVLVACGSAWHASLAAKYSIEELAKLPTEALLSSEFRYALPPLDKNTLVIAVSQSGETADTLAAIRAAKEHNALCLAICNVVGSSLTRDVHTTLYTFAGPEISVASTKAYTSQLALLNLIALYLARIRKTISPRLAKRLLNEIKILPAKIKEVLSCDKSIKDCAESYKKVDNYLYIGRRNNLPTAYEGALKMKEISYIHAEGYGAGEMKHGPLALVDGSFPIVAVVLKGSVYEKMISNIQEIKSRNGIIIAIATKNDKNIRKIANWVVEIPPTPEFLSPILAAIPMQLLAYYTAEKKGREIDQPRNLAKSVTVE